MAVRPCHLTLRQHKGAGAHWGHTCLGSRILEECWNLLCAALGYGCTRMVCELATGQQPAPWPLRDTERLHLCVNQVWLYLVQLFYFIFSKTLWMKEAVYWFLLRHPFLVLLSWVSTSNAIPGIDYYVLLLTLWGTGCCLENSCTRPGIRRYCWLLCLIIDHNFIRYLTLWCLLVSPTVSLPTRSASLFHTRSLLL